MSENVIQTSFAVGELSPSLFARVDFAKYRSGAATMRNFFVDYRSGASSRPGTEFIRAGDRNSTIIRLVRFQQSTTVTYILEFGDGYIRFISDGASIVEPGIAITEINQDLPAKITAPGFSSIASDGDMVFVSGTAGTPQADDRYFYVNNSTADTFELVDGTTNLTVDSSNWGDYTGGGMVQRVFTLGSPYTQDELAMIKFSQKTSKMNITHPNHPPYVLTLTDALNWDLSPAVIGASIGGAGIFEVNSSTTGSVSYKYAVTSVDMKNQESNVGNVFVVNNVADLRSTAGSNQIVWNAVGGAFAYNVYGSTASYQGWNADVGSLGFIGSVLGTDATVFNDSNIAADFTQTPPVAQNPFAGVNPAVSSYFQQRLVYANGGGNLVQEFWCSKVGSDYNFDVSNPTQADDAITAELVSLEVNEIKSMIPMPSGLIMLTTKGAWQVSGGAGGVATQGGPITPSTITATPQAYVGANDVPPILVNYDILFVQAKGSIVRDLTYNIYANIYTGNDISILSSHLFFGHQIREWTYSEEPFKAIWCVREDGIALCLTLLKEQDMFGWSRHDTLGNFMSTASVTEGQLDATYFAVVRPNPSVPGNNIITIERLADRTFPFGVEDAWCVDCGAKTVANTPDATLSISPQDANGNVTLTASDTIFDSSMIGWVVRAGGGIITVTSFTDSSTMIGHVIQPITDLIPNDPQKRPDDATSGNWSIDKPFTIVYGLDHLEGQPVAVLADGGVVNGMVVNGGSITLPSPATKVIAGYGFQAQLQTMPLDLGNDVNTVQGKRKKIAALTVRVKDSRGLKAGRTFNLVTPIKELNRVTLMGLAVPFITSDERIIMDPLWDVPGQICLQLDDPLPSTVLGVIPEIVVGDTPK